MGVYQQGFISLTNGSNIVIGKGTKFLSFVHPGDQLSLMLQSTPITVGIESVDNQQQLTLTAGLYWTGEIDPWLTYSIELLPFQEKQNYFAGRLDEFQQIINAMEREPIESEAVGNLTDTSWYFATDSWRYKYANPETLSPDGQGGIRFFGADNVENLVGVGWFAASYSVLPRIKQRDSLLEFQLVNAHADLIELLNNPANTVEDIINYNPNFVMPAYPYT